MALPWGILNSPRVQASPASVYGTPPPFPRAPPTFLQPDSLGPFQNGIPAAPIGNPGQTAPGPISPEGPSETQEGDLGARIPSPPPTGPWNFRARRVSLGGVHSISRGQHLPPRSPEAATPGCRNESGRRSATEAGDGGGGGGFGGPAGLRELRDVAAANFSLHEAHCQRFLAICPECEEPVALKDMKAHHGEAHQQVRCRLCHQAMQQYLLQHHEAEECPERPVQCRFCDLELPFQRLQPHLEACGSRTTSCWDCGKYVMYRTLEEHNATFHASHGPKATGEPKDNICELCKGQFSDEQYLQHLNECAPLPQLLGLLSPGSPTEQDSKAEEKAVRPRSQGRGAPSLLGKPSLKPPKGKRVHSRLAFTALDPQVLEESGHREDPAYDQLAACNGCNILLPSPTLEKHERKCRQRKAASGQALRRSPRLSGRGESAGQHSPSKEAHGQL
ncbi:XIAP-associated factor 1 isoform X2 [Pogona vitticeps]